MAFLEQGMMFLLPPSDLSRKFFTSDRPHMIGVFGDQKAAAAQSSRLNGGGGAGPMGGGSMVPGLGANRGPGGINVAPTYSMGGMIRPSQDLDPN